MNILYLTGNLNVGGTEIYTMSLAKGMRQKNHNVFWATIKEGTLKEEVIKEGIELKYCNLNKRTPLNFISSMLRINSIIKDCDIELIHAVDAYSALVVTMALKMTKRKPKFIWSNVAIGEGSYDIMRVLCQNSFDVIIAASGFIKDTMLQHRFKKDKIKVQFGFRLFDNTTSENFRDELSLGINDVVIGSIGRIVKMKGGDILLQAVAPIIALNKNVKVVFFGAGDYILRLRDLAKDLEIENNVIFAGNQTNIEKVYNTIDIVAFPTQYEALGYIPFEAMFYRKPLIASRTGGIPEVVENGYNGLLVDPANVSEWTNKLKQLLFDKDIRDSLVKNGTNYYNKYLSSERALAGFEEIYNMCK